MKINRKNTAKEKRNIILALRKQRENAARLISQQVAT